MSEVMNLILIGLRYMVKSIGRYQVKTWKQKESVPSLKTLRQAVP